MLPGNDRHRAFMRENGKKKDGQRNVIPPQIFNGDQLRGDFEDFDISNEDDILEEFLGIDRENPKMDHVKTGAVAPEIKKLKVGKLSKDGNLANLLKKVEKPLPAPKQADPSRVQDNLTEEAPASLPSPSPKEPLTSCTSSVISGSSESGKLDEETDSGIDMEEENMGDAKEDAREGESEGNSECGKSDEEGLNGCKQASGDSDGNDLKKDSKYRPLTADEILEALDNAEDSETDTEDFTDSEDDTVEYMADGEVMRKCKRGFKQLNNCKRFWKVSNNL